MAGRLDGLQPHAPDLDAVPVVQRGERVLRSGGGPQVDRRAGAVAQLEMSRDEVGVQMREEHVRDSKAVLSGEGQVLIDVALRIDNGRRPGLLVADEV